MAIILIIAYYLRRYFLLYDIEPEKTDNDVREGFADGILSAITDILIAQFRFVIFAVLLLPVADVILIVVLFVTNIAVSIDYAGIWENIMNAYNNVYNSV